MRRPQLDLVALRAELVVAGVDGLVVDDLRAEDLDRLDWSGSRAHLRSVARQLERAATGEVEYLVVRAPGGDPVAKGGIDYAVQVRLGVIWQVVIHEAVRGVGIGTRLLAVAEARARARGCRMAALSVEVDNRRAARALRAPRLRRGGHPRHRVGGRRGRRHHRVVHDRGGGPREAAVT